MEEGKWYYFTNNLNIRCGGRLKRHDNELGYHFEYITANTGFKQEESMYFINISDIEPMPKQEALIRWYEYAYIIDDDFVESIKIGDLVTGKFYVGDMHQWGLWLFRFDGIIEDVYIKASYTYDLGSSFTVERSNILTRNPIYNIREATDVEVISAWPKLWHMQGPKSLVVPKGHRIGVEL